MADVNQKLNIVLRVITKSFSAGLSVAGGALGTFVAGVQLVGRVLGGIVRRLKLIALAASALFVMLIKQAADFEYQMAFVSTMIKDTGKWIGNFTKEIKRLATKTGESLESISKSMYDILSARVPPEFAAKVLETTTKAAVAGFTDASETGKLFVTIMNAMGISFNQVDKVADVLFRTVEKGQLTFRELPGHMSRSMVAARAARMPFEELAATYAFLTRNGFNAAQAETAIAQALTKVMAPTEESIEAATQLGVSIGETEIATKGLLGVIQELAKAKLSPEEVQRIFPSIRAQRMISALINNVEAFTKDVNDMYNSAGAATRAFAKGMDTLTRTWMRFKQEMKVLFLEIITPMIPAIRQLFERVKQLGSYLKGLISAGSADKIRDVAFSVVKWIEGAIFWLIKYVPYIFGKIWGYLKLTYKMIGEILDFGPIGLFGFAILSFFKNIFKNLWNMVTTFVTNTAKAISVGAKLAYYYIKGQFVDTTEDIMRVLSEVPKSAFEKFKFIWEVEWPKSFKRGMEKVVGEFKIHSDELEKELKNREKFVREIKEKELLQEFKKLKETMEDAIKIRHKFEDEEIRKKRKTDAIILKEELLKIKRLKEIGQLSLEDEAKRLGRLLKYTRENTESRIKLEKRLYEIGKRLRKERMERIFQFIDGYTDYEKRRTLDSERNKILVRMKYLKKFIDYEAKSYEERKEAFEKLVKLRIKLYKHEYDEMKKVHDELISDRWKALRDQEKQIKKIIFEYGNYENVRKNQERALTINLRQQTLERWKFIRNLVRKDGKEWDLEGLRKLKVAERHINESIKYDKLSKKEKEQAEKDLDRISRKIKEAEFDVFKNNEEKKKEMLKEGSDFKKQIDKEFEESTGKQTDRELEEHKSRLEHMKELEKKSGAALKSAGEKVKEFAGKIQNEIVNAVNVAIKALDKLEGKTTSTLGELLKFMMGAGEFPAPKAGGGITDEVSKIGGIVAPQTKIGNIKVQVGQISSEVDFMKMSEKMSEKVAEEVFTKFRP